MKMDDRKGRMDDASQSHNDMEEGAEPKKRARQRKKLLIDRIRLQMEFYFSASNLSKDQFMNKLLRQSPYIDLEVFLRFNRLRALSEDIKMIRKAISKSQILELSDDGMKVKRSSEARAKENEMDCTIYVENIPSHADHEWVHEIFAQYGTIDYISLPHFKNTGRPKGFAFIEFQTPEISNIALEAFGAIGCKISQDLQPSELQSIRTYETENEQKHTQASENSENHGRDSQSNSQNMEDNGTSEKESMGKKKRKRSDDGNGKSKKAKEGDSESEAPDDVDKNTKEATENPNAADESENVDEKIKQDKDSKKRNKPECDVEKAIKKVRREVEEANANVTDKNIKSSKRKSLDKSENEDITKSKKQKVDISDTVSAPVTGNESAVEEEDSGSKKNKKKKKRKRNKKEKMEAIEGVSLKVMSKKEWVRLRNQYLNAQRLNMRHLKDDLHKRRTNESLGTELHRPFKSNQGMPTYTSNAVIKISFEEPPQDPRKLQETIREGGSGGVAYVETSLAEKDVYVRFFSAEAASSYLKAGLWSRMVLLSGNEEKEYWDHCIDSWQRSRNKGPKPNKENRGKEKLLQKALKEASMRKPSTHITFN